MMSADTVQTADRLIGYALKAGAESADVLVAEAESVNAEVRCGKLEQIECSESVEAGLRVLLGTKQACVSTSDLREESLKQIAEEAVAMARAAPDDPCAGLAAVDELSAAEGVQELDLMDLSDERGVDVLRDTALQAEAAAMAVDGVQQTESSSAGRGSTSIYLGATNGFSGIYRRSGSSVSCVAISGSGLEMEMDYCFESRVHASDLPSPEWVGRCAGERAAARAGPTRPPTGAFPVLFDRRVSDSLIAHLLSAINGSAIARGSSWLLDAMESPVLPDDIDLLERPLMPRFPGSRPFDAEGLPCRDKPIVKQGQLLTWILDLATARKLGLKSTGNASRGTASPPSPSVTNVQLPDGSHSRDDLIHDMGTGLIVTSLIGSTINPTTGDYSRGASGFWVENREITGPVSEFTIAGNLKRMLRSITPSDDSLPMRRIRVPSLLVEGLTIAGG